MVKCFNGTTEMTAYGCSVMYYTVTQHGADEVPLRINERGTTTAHKDTALGIEAGQREKQQERKRTSQKSHIFKSEQKMRGIQIS